MMRQSQSGLLCAVLVAAFAGQAPASQNDWSGMTLSEMLESVQLLRTSEAVDELHSAADWIQVTYMEPSAVVLPGTCTEWRWLAEHLRPVLSPERRTQWQRVLRQTYATPDQLGALPAREAAELGKALYALGDPDAMSLIIDVGTARGAEVWEYFGSMEINALAGHLAGAGADQQVRRDLAKWLMDERLVDETSAHRLTRGVGYWRMVVLNLREVMDEPDRAAWADRLRAIYVDSDDWAARRGGEVESLIQTLEHLGEVDTTQVLTRWLGARSSLDPADRRRLSSRVGVYIRVARLGDGSLDSDNVAMLAGALRGVGESPAASALSAAWLRGGGNRQTLSASALGTLVVGLMDAGAAGWHARQDLATLVADRILGDDDQVRAVRPGEWHRVIEAVGDSLSAAARREWAGRLWDAYRQDRVVPAMDRDELRHLVWAVRKLDADAANRCAAQWLLAADEWRKDPANAGHYASETIWYAYVALGGAAAETGLNVATTIERLGPVWEEAYAAGTLSYSRCELLSWVYFWRGDRQQSRRWLYRAQDVLVNRAQDGEPAGLGNLVSLARTMASPEFGLIREGTAFPVLAAMVAEHVTKGGTIADWAIAPLSQVCHGSQAREVLHTVLLDDNGLPRLEVAQLLARSHRADGSLTAWDGYVQERLTGATTGDAAAAWLLVQADAETLRGPLVDARRGRQAIIKALAFADAPEMRVQAARQLVARHTVSERVAGLDAARQVVAALQEQAIGAEAEGLAALEQEIRTRRAAAARRNAYRAADLEHARLQAQLQGYQRMLARAQILDDGAAAAAIEEQIRSLTEEGSH